MVLRNEEYLLEIKNKEIEALNNKVARLEIRVKQLEEWAFNDNIRIAKLEQGIKHD